MSGTARSIYLGDAIVAEIDVRSVRLDRSWSQATTRLIRLALRVPRERLAVPDRPDATKDDARGRRYFYPPAEVDEGVKSLQARLNTPKHVWSYSAICRLLINTGMRLEDMAERYTDTLFKEEPPPCSRASIPSSTSELSPIRTAIAES